MAEWIGYPWFTDQQDLVPAQIGDLGAYRLGGGAQETLAPFPHSLRS